MLRNLWPLALLACSAPLLAQQADSPAIPTPSWVQIVDQGQADPQLKGLKTPRGFKLEIVAAGSLAGSPRGIAFDDGGGLWVLNGSRLRQLSDPNGDGVFDEAAVEMSDLASPAAVLASGGWVYCTAGGRVFRTRAHEQKLFEELQAAAAAKTGPPTFRTADGRWIEQPLVGGLSRQSPYQASGLAMGADGWLYVSCGSGDQRAESWDGARVMLLRSGGILRMRPDGSRLQEFARGLLRPGRLAIDPLGQIFAADRDWNGAGSGGLRLIHVLAGGDYGWQHAEIAAADKARPAARGVPDRLRAAAGGERAGTLPPIHRTDSGSQGNALWWESASFPDFCQNRLLATEPDNHRLRVYQLERAGEGFRVANQFDLLVGGESFHPVAAATGPDGGLYVAAQTSEAEGLIFRLSWSGAGNAPAIELAPRDSWSKLDQASDEELAAMLESSAGEMRRRVALRMAARGKQEKALTILADNAKSLPARAAALSVVCQSMDAAGREAVAALLADEQADLSRLAADALGDFPPEDNEALLAAADQLKGAPVSAADPQQQRALQLALGKLAAAAKSVELAEWNFEGTSVTHGPKMSRIVFDGHVRALELVQGAAKELMLGNFDVALNLPEAEPLERQRIKEFVVRTAEAMRTRELTDFLDALLRGEENPFRRLDAPLEARLLACYRNVLTDPPINADAAAEWLEKNPGGPVEVEIAGLETLSLVGTTKTAFVEKLADRLLTKPADALLVARSLLAGRLNPSLLPRIKAALINHKAQDSTGEIAALLKQLETIKPPSAVDTGKD